MLVKLLSFLPVYLLSLNVVAQVSASATVADTLNGAEITKAAPVIIDDALLVDEREHNFGKIPQGKPVTHVFEVTNNGKDSLHIVNIQASCGCTTPDWDRKKVPAPGEKTTITVGYNAATEGLF
jgi:uncharacterized NAD-dependent epimerase/dehydratase family protein